MFSMNEFIGFLENNWFFSLFGFIASVITIFGLFRFSNKSSNTLNGSEVGGDFVGGNRNNPGNSKTKNKIKKTSIKGDYIGGDDNK